MLRETQFQRGMIFGHNLIARLIVFGVFACSASVAAAADIRIGGTVDACQGFFEVFKDLVKEQADITLVITPSSSTQSLMDLDRGNIDIAATDATLESSATDLENRGSPVIPDQFRVQGIGTNSILVYLNKSNKILELTQEQLSGIFSGEITNWEQVGGHNQEITVVWGDATPENNQLFQRYVIGSRPIVKSAVWATDQRDILEQIMKTPGAIGISSIAYQSARTYNPKTPFVSATVVAITKGAPKDKVQKLIEIIKGFDN
jgi:phosphate transport system substrate-binding protein